MMMFHTSIRALSLAAVFSLMACSAFKPVPPAPLGPPAPPQLLEETDTPNLASDFLEDIEHKTFDFFWANANP